ncbi:CocE/NonD family hydrolase [Variovorax sp. dw_954]|uniref:CocE/NonD family hydrolase n=1 Tax=Variovorax sp. dw_954 TaxID=2720078 RepID=UPI001BD1C7CA|nr:CocE/NonD family hydrolase [Variovorax sp. dw_954]
MTKASGIDNGQRRLNGPQTSGRNYRNLSEARFDTATDEDVAVPMRDGVQLRADVHRPAEPGRYPVLIAASPYPRQIQNSGAPLGFVEAGASDFFVPRGYVHVIANCRGTGGSDGVFGFFDGQERQDMYDLVEWAAAQPWSDGNVGMVGISYFAMTQMEAAVGRPPHLKAIMPIAGSFDLYDAAMHHGLASISFLTPFLYMVGMTSGRTNAFWRSTLLKAVSALLRTPAIHKKFETANGEAALTGLRALLKLHHDPHPWDDLWRAIIVEHPLRDAWWDERNLMPLLERVEVPVYLGCDWQNVPLHLPATFPTLQGLVNSKHVQTVMLGEHGLAWPWESLHIEALAWFDHWLKGHDTGILEGPKFRYVIPEAEGWHAADSWPVAGTAHRAFALRADGGLSDEEGPSGDRTLMVLGGGVNRPQVSKTDPPASLVWQTPPLAEDVDMVGDIELQLDAASTAPDTAWIAVLQDVDAEGKTTEVTAGYLRAGLRKVDEDLSRTGAPVLACRTFEAVPIGETVRYRIPLVANARRFKAGHQIRLHLTSDDQDPTTPASMTFRHANVGMSCLNRVRSSSRVLLPIVGASA